MSKVGTSARAPERRGLSQKKVGWEQGFGDKAEGRETPGENKKEGWKGGRCACLCEGADNFIWGELGPADSVVRERGVRNFGR